MKQQIGKTLYRIDSKDKTRQWEIVVQHLDDGTANKITTTGIKDGALIPSVIHITEGKNIGKANETTPVAQAILEAEADYKQALKKGYVADITKATKGVSGSGNLKPMLAETLDPTMQKKKSKSLEKLGIVGVRGALQPKKDGNRCTAKVTKDGAVSLITRSGDEFPPIRLVESDLLALSKVLNYSERDEYVLDGELMSPEMTFNQLNGLLSRKKSSKLSTEEHERLINTVVFHIYDVMLSVGYSERYEILENAFGVNAEIAYPHLRLIESVEVDLSTEIINQYLAHWLEQDEEGLMVRLLDKPYEYKRTWQLMKYKNFEDAEYEVISMEADKKGNLGKFYCKPNEQLFDRDGKEIISFKAGTRDITHAEGREMLANQDQYIGKMATVRFQLTSEYGVPRFGKVVGFRNDI